jgi:hypothetical protein
VAFVASTAQRDVLSVRDGFCGSLSSPAISIRALFARFLLAPASLAWLCHAAHAECKIEPYHFDPGQQISTSMAVLKDTGCSLHMRAGNGIADGVMVIQRPHHGRYGSENPGSFAYIPQRGFTGDDAVAVRVFWHTSRGNPTRDAWAEVTYRIKVVSTWPPQ